MKGERWKKIDELFGAALELSGEERKAFLDAACAGDPSLRREVEKMLGFDERAEQAFEKPAFDVAAGLMTGESVFPTARREEAPRPRQGGRSSFHPESIEGARFVPGDKLAGRYRVVGLLGRGGMGEVYRADDLVLKQPVALKFLPESLSNNSAALARFYQEVRAARQVSHKNVCRVYDVGEAEGQHFISMEFVRGEELSSLLKRIGRLPQDKALEIARQLCAGLAAIHEKGLLHRDLKPANVMIDEVGSVRITDFGLAIPAEDSSGREALAGTPGYMSPEQLEGVELTAQSDVYSLGLVLYELFTGRRAFEAPTLAEMLRLRRGDSTPTSPSDLVPDLDPLVERIIWRCLDRDPRKRPATALGVAAALPGGDPLAAALAAGETPTPEMVVAAPEEGALRPSVAVVLLAASLVSLSLLVLLSGQVLAVRQVPLEKSPEVLAERARSIVAGLGYAEAPAGEAYGFGVDTEYYRYILRNDQSMSRWERLRTGQPAFIYFWHRQGPRPLEAQATPRVSETDPPPLSVSGMADVRLDTLGRLIELEVSPPQLEAGHDAPARPGVVTLYDRAIAQPDWAALFKEAGLDISKFMPSEPRWTPPVYADTRGAWEGVFPWQPGTPLRIEAAGYQGRPVYFQLVAPWDKPYRMQPYETDPATKKLLVFVFGLFLTVLLGGAWMVRRNLRLGRGDRKGAFRLALFIFVANLTGELIGASHVAAFGGELWVLFLVVTKSLFFPALMWLVYMALEPHLRRRAPHRIISWSRLLAGAYRDPLVGRDVLVGVLLGVWMQLSQWLGELANRLLHNPPDIAGTQLWSLLGVRGIAPNFLGIDLGMSLLHGLGFSFLLLLLSLVLRGERRGAAAVWLLLTGYLLASALEQGNSALVVALFAVPLATVYVFVAVRFGLLSLTVAQFVFFMCLFYPYTPDFTVWYAGVTVFALSVTTALAVYGFRTSLAGRPLLRDGVLGD